MSTADRVELTEDERSEIGLAVQEGDASGLCIYVQSIVAARVAELTAEVAMLREALEICRETESDF